MFGGLHIEMAAFRSLGSLLQDSGWMNAITEAEVASPGLCNHSYQLLLPAQDRPIRLQCVHFTNCKRKHTTITLMMKVRSNPTLALNHGVKSAKKKVHSLSLGSCHVNGTGYFISYPIIPKGGL